MIRRVAVLCLGIGLLVTTGLSEAAVTIAVKAESSVNGPSLTLSDIAVVSGDDAQRVKLLKDLQLGNAPPPGVTAQMTPELLEPRLLATRADFSGITWIVPKLFRIATASQFVSGRSVQDAAESYLKHLLEKEGAGVGSGDLTVNRLDVAQDMRVPVGKLELATELYGQIKYNVPTTVMTIIRTDGRSFNRIPLRFELRRFQNVAVTVNGLAAGDPVTASTLRFERMDVGKLPAGYIADVVPFDGWLLRYAVTPGTVITEAMLVKPLLVRRGDTIRIVARVGQMEVSAAGLALSQGGIGDRIRVQNLDSKRYLSGRIQADKSVLVLEDRGG